MNSQRIAVTGGAGFLGSHVVRELLSVGDEVVVLDDFSNGKRWHLDGLVGDPALTVIEGDITNPDDVARSFEGAAMVVHLAVLGLRQSILDPVRVNQVIVDGTLVCLEVARRNHVDLFVNCSSSEVFGTASYVPMDEQHPLNPETPYAAAKVAQDMYVRSYGQTYGLPWLTVRPFNMYGPNSHWQGARGEVIPKMIVRAMNGEPLVIFGKGDQTRDFLYVEDAARAVVSAARQPECRGQTLNVASGKGTSIRRVAELICELMGLSPTDAISYQSSRPGDVQEHVGDSAKLAELTGFTPEVDFGDGLARTIEWFQSLPFAPADLMATEALRAWEGR